MSPVDRPWLISQQPSPYAEFRLFCFPYAGGSASAYHQWPGLAPSAVQVCAVELPGRGIRLEEAACHSFGPLIRDLADRIEPLLKGPFAFFGHSMGGLVAYELTRALRERGAPQPRHLFVSASATPGSPPRRRSLHGASDAEVVEELVDLGGTPQWVLSDQELMALAVPTLRADYAALGSYDHRPGAPLEVPITVFGGRADTVVPPADLHGWQRLSTAGSRLRLYPGDHFFLNDAAEHILATVAETVGSAHAPDGLAGSFG
ncbi:thioesterase II family protein [Streptomyces sp. NPDC002446]